jgi:Mn2+/Fe2+ NRAMP family transporter
MAACAIAAQAILPAFVEPGHAKVVYGLAHSLLGLALVWRGGFKLFERVMGVCIGVMFVTVLLTAMRLDLDLSAVVRGLVVPVVPAAVEGALSWTMALIGGVGGTLTILCYGYWMAESGRTGAAGLKTMRLDLVIAYGLTALFGMAMVAIGSEALTREGSGAALVVQLAETLGTTLGPAGAWIFLAGAWGAFFSSLLGVWQSVPYLFADFYYRSRQRTPAQALTQTAAYRGYLIGLALLPAFALGADFKALAKYYSLVGAFFMPCLALILLYLNNLDVVPPRFRNRWGTNLALVIIVVFFAIAGYQTVMKKFGG